MKKQHTTLPAQSGAIVAVLFLLTTILAACNNPLTGPGAKQAPSKDALTEQPITAVHHSQRTVTVCADVTSSYPYSDFMAAKAKIADAVDASTQVNQDGLTAFFTLIESNSWDPAATIATITIPALAPDPSPPMLLPMPTASKDPYASANATKAAKDTNTHMVQIYQQSLHSSHTKLAAAQAQVQTQTKSLRGLRPPVDAIQTDVTGCVERQAARFQGLPGEKYLFIASDGENNTTEQDTGSLDLRGVHVRFIYFYCQNATMCTNNYWHDRLMQAGAAEVSFFDPSQSQDLATSTLFS